MCLCWYLLSVRSHYYSKVDTLNGSCGYMSRITERAVNCDHFSFFAIPVFLIWAWGEDPKKCYPRRRRFRKIESGASRIARWYFDNYLNLNIVNRYIIPQSLPFINVLCLQHSSAQIRQVDSKKAFINLLADKSSFL